MVAVLILKYIKCNCFRNYNYELDNIILYPNQVQNILHIEIEKEFTGTIFDIIGKALMT